MDVLRRRMLAVILLAAAVAAAERHDEVKWVAAGVGPGSAPPSCGARCGRCAPCRAVHVAIQPGFSAPMEYYPEAWRCKCGNKIYMPS